MNASLQFSEQVKNQMNQMPIHDSWEASYRTAGNEKTYELCFDQLVGLLRQPAGSSALDIGCGICANGIRLARRGYRVTGSDYSQVILDPARANVARHGLSDRIDVRREDILALSFPDGTFDLTLCWGVLMHIPLADRALAELARVTRPGGYLVFEEINPKSPEAGLMRGFWRTFRGHRINVVRTHTGYEQSTRFNGEQLFWRHTDPRWLTGELRKHGVEPVAVKPGLFSDLHMFAKPAFTREIVHRWNRWWLRRVRTPQAAYHNIYIYRKGAE